ncbi:unnamed protein product [Symbiodinium sp. CCMP2592]|nr:unnamed protein product [Symbiodinium sp. CCMP2592]
MQATCPLSLNSVTSRCLPGKQTSTKTFPPKQHLRTQPRIAILCEVITAVADAEKEALQVSWTTEVLQTCLSAGADQNNDGCIDLQEFHSMLQNQQVRKVLHEVDVDVQTLVNFADVLFEDDEGTTQPQLPFADFMQRLLQLRGRNTATVKAPQVLADFAATFGEEV